MNLFKKPIFCLAFALLILPKSGFTQYQFEVDPFFSYFTDLKRYDLCFSYVMPSAQFAGVVPAYANGNFIGDTTAKRKTPGTGIGGSIGLSIPFKATGHISCWAMDIQLMANMYTWTNLNETYSLDGSYKPVTPDLGATTLQVALPIGISYKAGNEVIESKRLKLCTSLGAGFMPNYNMTSLSKSVEGIGTHSAIGFNPYFKFEAGMFMGIDVKLRFLYTLGDVTLIDVNRPTDPIINGPFKVTSTSNLIISLILMPFSGGWHETSWYTTHDTYNQHDRLN